MVFSAWIHTVSQSLSQTDRHKDKHKNKNKRGYRKVCVVFVVGSAGFEPAICGAS